HAAPTAGTVCLPRRFAYGLGRCRRAGYVVVGVAHPAPGGKKPGAQAPDLPDGILPAPVQEAMAVSREAAFLAPSSVPGLCFPAGGRGGPPESPADEPRGQRAPGSGRRPAGDRPGPRLPGDAWGGTSGARGSPAAGGSGGTCRRPPGRAGGEGPAARQRIT